jgi:hypothetical protein
LQTFHSKNCKVLGFYSEGIPGIGQVWILEDLSNIRKHSDSTNMNSKFWNPRYILSKEFKLIDSGQVYFYKSNGTVENRLHHLVEHSPLF